MEGGWGEVRMMKMSRNIYTNYKSLCDQLHQKKISFTSGSKLFNNKNITKKDNKIISVGFLITYINIVQCRYRHGLPIMILMAFIFSPSFLALPDDDDNYIFMTFVWSLHSLRFNAIMTND